MAPVGAVPAAARPVARRSPRELRPALAGEEGVDVFALHAAGRYNRQTAA
jgi:hypothetical protein